MVSLSQINSYSFLGLLTCGNSKGTAFLVEYKGKLYLVTDRHVVYKSLETRYADYCFVMFHTQNSQYDQSSQLQLELSGLDNLGRIKESEEDDLLVIDIDDCQDITKIDFDSVKGMPLIPVTLSKIWGNHILMYGFPTSIKPRSPFDFKPFLSSGIVSSIDEATQQFVIDAPAYYGNSGGPVFRKKCGVSLIGIVQKLIPFNLEWHIVYEEIKRTDWHNTGYSICRSSNSIIKLIER